MLGCLCHEVFFNLHIWVDASFWNLRKFSAVTLLCICPMPSTWSSFSFSMFIIGVCSLFMVSQSFLILILYDFDYWCTFSIFTSWYFILYFILLVRLLPDFDKCVVDLHFSLSLVQYFISLLNKVLQSWYLLVIFSAL